MLAGDAPLRALRGDDLLVAVNDAMVELHKRYHHRAPVTAKTVLLDDELLISILGGVYTDVEKTMIEVQRGPIVQETRSAFQTVMEHKFINIVERLSGREVLIFISNQHVGPDMEVEVFVLKPNLPGTLSAEDDGFTWPDRHGHSGAKSDRRS
jgi:uncharacterized protein YbcI